MLGRVYFLTSGSKKLRMIELALGNILNIEADVAVLSAHPTLIAGSGLSGLFHKAAGKELELAAEPLGPIEPGMSTVTQAFHLPFEYIVHAVAPGYLRDLDDPEQTLKKTYLSIFDHKELCNCKSIVVPAIGIGIYRWPIELAAEIALSALEQSPFEKSVICLYEQATFDIYSSLIDR